MKFALCCILSIFIFCQHVNGMMCTNKIQPCIKTFEGCFAPYKDTMQCSVGCQGVNNPSITVQSITVEQDGKPVDSQGGMSFKKPMKVAITGVNNHGRVSNPLVDVWVSYCTKVWYSPDKCHWKKESTFGMTSNLDPCDVATGAVVINDCHLTKIPAGQNGEIINLTVDLNNSPAMAEFIGFIHPGYDYLLEVTIKDGTTPLICITAQDMVIKD